MLTPKPIDPSIFQYLRVEPETGVLIWTRSMGRAKGGDEAGNENRGYRYVTVRGVCYAVHRVIFFYVHGWCPDRIDHEDKDGLNCSINNLRPATNRENAINCAIRRTNKSGFRGVHFDASRGKWMARVAVAPNVEKNLGRFATAEEAARVYDAAAVRFYGEFAQLNFPT